MSSDHDTLHLPDYQAFVESIAALMLQISASELHGLLCGYLCAGADRQGESYIRALLQNKKSPESRHALLSLFSVFSISQQQISSYDLEFALLLPKEENPLRERAKAFSQWCEGFTQGLTLAGVDGDHLYEEDAQDALQHLVEFAELDYDSLEVDEDDERALMEVTEYARMAVIRLHGDLMMNKRKDGHSGTAH
ncbi:UPF0149 family protein [Legionella sp. km772]|uniref:UPF0149 family protein n=1 Tax=Legionella sp. km772 TaxID=2498111 RepID=UPI000F8E9422|nr:UPF0149 family protein [Legionella sp. km772]RUR13534.1 YecA family protein [Legionella sp. km772]